MNKLLILVVVLLPSTLNCNVIRNTKHFQVTNFTDIIFEQSLTELTVVSEQLEDLSHKLEIIKIYKEINHE